MYSQIQYSYICWQERAPTDQSEALPMLCFCFYVGQTSKIGDQSHRVTMATMKDYRNGQDSGKGMLHEETN